MSVIHTAVTDFILQDYIDDGSKFCLLASFYLLFFNFIQRFNDYEISQYRTCGVNVCGSIFPCVIEAQLLLIARV